MESSLDVQLSDLFLTLKMYLVCLVRWGNTPLDDALQFGHSGVVAVLQEYQKGYSDTEAQPETEEQKTTLDTVKVVV